MLSSLTSLSLRLFPNTISSKLQVHVAHPKIATSTLEQECEHPRHSCLIDRLISTHEFQGPRLLILQIVNQSPMPNASGSSLARYLYFHFCFIPIIIHQRPLFPYHLSSLNTANHILILTYSSRLLLCHIPAALTFSSGSR